MDHLEKVEELVAKIGCSYADAKDALERADWNMLDAIILLEQDGKTESSSSRFSTDEAHAEPASDRESCEYEPASDEEVRRDRKEEAKEKRRNFANACRDFVLTVRDVLTRNYLTIFSRSGSQLLHIPIWIAIIPLLIWFKNGQPAGKTLGLVSRKDIEAMLDA